MTPSLSALVPVHNAQNSVGLIVSELLDVLPELTPRFDILLIDDGSTDSTVEVAYELSRGYPQVKIASHPSRLGFKSAIQTGLMHTSGETVLLRSETCRLNLYEIHKLWKAMPEVDLVFARSDTEAPLGWIARLPGTGDRGEQRPAPDMHLMRRGVALCWHDSGDQEDLISYVQRSGFPMREVKLGLRHAPATAGSLADMLHRKLVAMSGPESRTQRADVAAVKSASSRRPNYLEKLKAFALGE